MTKREAHALIDSATLTWGELKTVLRCEMGGPDRVSTVNPGMTHEQALMILAAGIDARPDDDVVAGPKSLTPNRDRLAATNILRECGEFARAVLARQQAGGLTWGLCLGLYKRRAGK